MGARLELRSTFVDNVGRGVHVFQRLAELTDCEIEKCNVLAVDHSVLVMRTCVCKGTVGNNGVEVSASDCRLQGVTVVGSNIGFCLDSIPSYAVIADCNAVDIKEVGLQLAGAGARVCVQGFEMQDAAQQEAYGVIVCNAGRADLVSCKLAARSDGCAVAARDERSEVGGEDCQLSGRKGASVIEEAQLTLQKCATCECGSVGYIVGKRAVLKLYHCTSTRDVIGVFCIDQGHLHAEDCELRSFACGAFVKSVDGIYGATCRLDHCRFVDTEPSPTPEWSSRLGGVGVFLEGKGAHVSMHECTVSGTAGDCVMLIHQAKGTLEGCQLSHSHANGVACVDQGSQFTLDGGKVSRNGTCGVICEEGGRVVARRVHSCGNNGAGFAAYDNSSMTLKECSSDRDHDGCLAFGETPEGTVRVVLSGVLVRRSSAAGFAFDSNAKCAMKHCVALQCGGYGLLVRASETGGPTGSGTAPGLNVFDSTFERCGEGVAAHEGCAVDMQNVLCSRNVGCDFVCRGADSRLALTRCEAEGSGEPYHCEDGGQLHCIECRPIA